MPARQLDWVLHRLKSTLRPNNDDAVTDGELLRRFVHRKDEAAFAALVRRHAPMVLSVCRRVLGNEADAEDAFQAAFLVLVRKAPSVRPPGMVGNWLYGVANRTAREARRAGVRRRVKEAKAMPRTEAEADTAVDLRAVLDQELDRIPDKYRAAIVLCDLEGKTRREAARELGCAEGTVASRQARGRALLSERLSRRGFGVSDAALAAVLPPEGASAGVPASLMDSTLKAAGLWAAGQTAAAVSAQVAALTEGVLKAMLLTKLKTTAVVFLAVATAGLGVGALMDPTRTSERAAAPADPQSRPEVLPQEKPADDRPVLFGKVVDEQGVPVAGVLVHSMGPPEQPGRTMARTDAAGRFPLSWWRSSELFVAQDADGQRQGILRAERAEPGEAIRITLKPARVATVRVADAQGRPVSGARVALMDGVWSLALVSDATRADGTVVLHYPAEATVGQVIAFKAGVGFDYTSTLVEKHRRERKPLPEEIALNLTGARTVRVKAVDSSNQPVAGLPVFPWYVQQAGKLEDVNLSSYHDVFVVTDAAGVAVFDWLPEDFLQAISFVASTAEYSYVEQISINRESPATELTMRLLRKTRISGRVRGPDGRPAAGIVVEASGAGASIHSGWGRVETKPDGSYEMFVNSEQTYIVTVVDDRWAAPSHMSTVVREDKPVSGLDFQLAEGTVVRGTVTVGPDRRPLAGQHLSLGQRAGQIPGEIRKPGDNTYREVSHYRRATTDGEGRFRFRVGPGAYELMGSITVITTPMKLTVADQRELVQDFHVARPEFGRLVGKVVDGDSRPVSGATVTCVYRGQVSRVPFETTTAADGAFAADRVQVPTIVYARTADRTRAGTVRIGPDQGDVTVRIGPLAEARGRLLNDQGEPVAGGQVKYGVHVYYDETTKRAFETHFGRVATSEADGQYVLTGLLTGEEYHVSFEHSPRGPWSNLTTVTPARGETIDLGDARVPKLYTPLTPDEKTAQLFRHRGKLPERIARARAEAKSHYLRVLLIVGDPKDEATRKLCELREDRAIAAALWEYEQLAVAADDAEALAVLRNDYGLDAGKLKVPALAVFGDDGRILGVKSPLPSGQDAESATKGLKEFLAAHALPRLDAEKLLADAQARARRENKRVFLQETATWCSWCHVLSRFMDGHKAIFDANYVFVKIDRSRFTHGDAVMQRYRTGEDRGIPWCAILDADGKMLANWDGPDGNLGYPSGAKGIDHFLQAIASTAPRVTPAQVAELRQALERKR